MWWNEKLKRWDEDEWLTQIYEQLCDAREAVYQFANGKPFDGNRDMQVTRYFGKRTDPFYRGKELEKGDPEIVEREWMRYAVYNVR